jgi:GTPase SAR1 family protein
MVGNSNVGKSKIIQRYISGEFDQNSKSTLGIEL